jgi:hypothetical protein
MLYGFFFVTDIYLTVFAMYCLGDNINQEEVSCVCNADVRNKKQPQNCSRKI